MELHISTACCFIMKKIEVWGMEETYDDLKKAAYVRRGWPLTPSGKVSIIIPTKDHPHILSNCIHSVLESGNYRDFEIIVVDNGSNEQNRARIERMRDMLNEDFRFVYHYEPMEFNFFQNVQPWRVPGDRRLHPVIE